MRLVLGDDHRLFAEPLAAALVHRGHEVFIATTVPETIRAVEEHDPDLCLMDLLFPDGDGLEAVAAVRARSPSCRVVVLSGSADPSAPAAAVASGAVGFLSKAQPVTAIFDALDRIAAGDELEPLPSPRASSSGDEHGEVRERVAALTRRERMVLQRLVEGEDTVEIARFLGVAASTARTHLQNVLNKLGVHSRLQAVSLVLAARADGEW
jgi:DNA-binding NarL/FixJ family response regulator